MVYHALNRANARLTIFEDDEDYAAFERTLAEAVTRYDMQLPAYCVMPNHFHLVLWPRLDGELSLFMGWLTMTHTQRWHAHRHSAGTGHLYQGRFKSFPVQDDGHFLTLCRYVERNPLRAGLVERAEHWRWGSLWRRVAKNSGDGPLLQSWPVDRPSDWVKRVNTALSGSEEEALRRAIRRGQPYGDGQWQVATAARLGLTSTLRPIGRPKKGQLNGS